MNRKRILNGGLKIALVLSVAMFVVYRIRYAPLPVESGVVKTGTISEEVMGTGTLEAHIHATISPKISGRIAQVLVDQGDKVTKGQNLVILDDEDLRQQVEVAKADLSATHASLEKAVSQINSAGATAKEAVSSYNRMAPLVSSGAISTDSFEKAQQNKDVAEAGLKQAQAAQNEAEKLVTKAEASLKYYQERLADTVVCAPFDGLIIKRYRDPGDIAVPGSMVLDMISLDELWISAWVDETMLGKLQVGQPAKILFRSEPKNELSGKVARISPEADSETREMLVDVSIDRLPAKWAVGQRAEVYIETAHKEKVMIIPQRVVVWHQGQAGVFVIEKGRAYWHKITIGIEGKDKIEVTNGLQPGQSVLVPGAKLPKEGQSIKVTTE